MGHAGQTQLLLLHELLCEKILACSELQARLRTLARSQAWYVAGSRLLAHYQRIKAEQRLLDFADLEWKTYQLLNHSDNAEWVQYKLDQRIQHLLIDEFQDTNPTQWNLILPLLQELTAGNTDGDRSVFIVGDSKQSIYRFRRADPSLLNTAHQWLAKNANASLCRLDSSWRSSPAIIDFMNQVFFQETLSERLKNFETHDTRRKDLPGYVELLPFVNADPLEIFIAPTDELRNPLQQPRLTDEDEQHYHEGRLIADRIKKLFDDNTLIGPAQATRQITYGDIIILLRSRTHAYAYERALREAGILYVGIERGTLLESLEVQDMLALLDVLIMPSNNLALAQVLRSPLFSCSDNDLISLATTHAIEYPGSWMYKLTTIATSLSDESPLKQAYDHLTRWQALAGHLPVHDLLDRIYHEGSVLHRYQTAFPSHLQDRVQGNLIRFIELALDIDSGRYPSLADFRTRLQTLSQADITNGGINQTLQSCVRVMTIHAAKGLESPVVFLADAIKSPQQHRSNKSLINWPSGAQKAAYLFLTGKKSELDKTTSELLEGDLQRELREEVNLLYVALSRAKQFLFISACAPLSSNESSWYDIARNRVQNSECGTI